MKRFSYILAAFFVFGLFSGRNSVLAQQTRDPGKSEVLSQTGVNVTFKNETAAAVEVIWVDFSGNEKPYGSLNAGQTKVQDTGHGHLWRFKQNGQLIAFYQATQLATQTYSVGGQAMPNPDDDNSLTGLWKDGDGHQIEIRQTGNQVVASAQSAELRRWWETGDAQMTGNRIVMDHKKAGLRTATESGTVSENFARIDWDNGTRWNRQAEESEIVNTIPATQLGYATTDLIGKLQLLQNRTPVAKQFMHSKVIPNYNPGTHVQGMAIFNDGTYLMTHNLNDSMGYQILTTSGQRLLFVEENIGHLQSGAQACGDFVAISTYLGEGKGSEARFYQKKAGQLERLEHLTIEFDSNLENVGFVYHPDENCHFVATNNNLFFQSNGKSLLDPNCKFELVENTTGANNRFPHGEAGGYLLFERNSHGGTKGSMYWASLDIDDNEDNVVELYEVDTINGSTTFAVNAKLKRSVKYNLSVIDVHTDSRPGFRWGGGIYIDQQGRLLATASERNAHGHLLNIAEWDPDIDFEDDSAIAWLEQAGLDAVNWAGQAGTDAVNWIEQAANDAANWAEVLVNGEKVAAPKRGTTAANVPEGVRHYVITQFHVTNLSSGDDGGGDAEVFGSVSAVPNGSFYTNGDSNQFLFNKRAGDRVILKDGKSHSVTERKDFYILEEQITKASSKTIKSLFGETSVRVPGSHVKIVSRLVEHDDFDNDHMYREDVQDLSELPVGYYKEFKLDVKGEEGEKAQVYYAVRRIK